MGRSLDEILKYVEEDDTIERHRALIKEMADSHFKDHIIEVEEENVFHCKRPGTGMYSFRVCFLPAGVILIYGDIGELMLQRGGFNWLSSAIRHNYVSDYVFEKARPQITWRTKTFLTGDAVAELRRMHDGVPNIEDGKNCVEECEKNSDHGVTDDCWEVKPNPVLACKIAEEWLNLDVSGQDGEAWSRAYYIHTGDSEHPDCRDYDASHLYCYYALAWFVEQRTEKQCLST